MSTTGKQSGRDNNYVMTEHRKRALADMITDGVKATIKEQQEQQQAAPPVPAVAPSAQPQQAAPPAEPTQAPEQQTAPPTVDNLVTRLNVIRGGSSFSDPEVYGQLTTFWNSLAPEQMTQMDEALASIGKIVTPANNQPGAQQQQQPQQQATPAPQPQQQTPIPPSP